jgi:hypothetical protein
VDALASDWAAEREITVLQIRKESAHCDRIHDGPRQRVFPECASFLEYADLNLTERPARFGVCLEQLCELDRACESSWSTSDEHDIHRNGFGIGRLCQYQPLLRKWSLMPAWQDAERTIRH